MNPTKAELDGLRHLLDYCFNENELHDLCFDWGKDCVCLSQADPGAY